MEAMSKERTFKVLMYGNIYVDMTVLTDGIYGTVYPKLHDKAFTIQTLIDQITVVESKFKPDTFKQVFENLRKCTLVEVTLTPKK